MMKTIEETMIFEGLSVKEKVIRRIWMSKRKEGMVHWQVKEEWRGGGVGESPEGGIVQRRKGVSTTKREYSEGILHPLFHPSLHVN